MFIDFREKDREGERVGVRERQRDRDRDINVRETLIGCLPYAPDQRSNLQPRNVPRLGMEAPKF